MGNVCITFDVNRFVDPFSTLLQVTEDEVGLALFGSQGKKYNDLFEKLERGEVSPSQFYMSLLKALGREGVVSYGAFARLWVDIFLKENDELEKLLDRISANHFLLSNINHIVHSRRIAHLSIIRKHFRGDSRRVLSYRVGAMKPDERIYVEALQRAGVPPEECLFVDDLLENIEAWKKLGGHGIVYNARHDSILHLERELIHLGVAIR